MQFQATVILSISWHVSIIALRDVSLTIPVHNGLFIRIPVGELSILFKVVRVICNTCTDSTVGVNVEIVDEDSEFKMDDLIRNLEKDPLWRVSY
ncbi:MAG: hypothetical protein RJA61_124 [Candidatus Parcubacteria bacterium]|jgi:hypothetical protein